MLASRTIAAVLVLGGSASAGRKHRNLNQKQFKKDLYGSSKKSAALRKKFISKSTFIGGRELQNNNNNNNYANWYSNQNDDGNGNNNNNANYNNWQQQQQAKETDDTWYDDTQAEEVEDWDNEYGFEPSKYSLAYHRCAAVQQFDDEVAAMDDSTSVFATKNFAIFRFCPSNSCDAKEGDDAEEDYQDQGGRRRLQNGQYGQYGEYSQYGENGQYAQQEDQAAEAYQQDFAYGARGKGCLKNYGEYMILLEDYLLIMAEYQQDTAEEYCTFCEEYMYTAYMTEYQNGNRMLRDLKFEEFKTQQEQMTRDLGIDYGVCAAYTDMCTDGVDDHLTEYFECKGAGDAFVGPHCAEDGFTITLGVYADNECNVFVGGDVADVIGEELEEDALKSWYNSKHGTLNPIYQDQEGEEESMCIPCQKTDYDWEDFSANADDDDAYDDDGDDDENAEVDYSDNEMSDLCGAVYYFSAHCHKNFKSFKKGQLSKRQWEEMQLSCSFIDSIVMGNYDEYGYVNLKPDWAPWKNENPVWARDNNMYASSTQQNMSISNVSPLQFFLLIFSALACAILGVWSKTLHTSLVKKKEPWAPRRPFSVKNSMNNMWRIFRKPEMKQPTIAPANSGIEQSRVQSAGSYYLS